METRNQLLSLSPKNFVNFVVHLNPVMARIMAIDYGLKRTGIAVTDPLQIIAGALTTIESKELFTFLKDYISREEVETIVVGYPLNLDGSPTDVTKTVDRLISKLEKAFPAVRLVREDERYTSKMAVRAMVEGGMKKKNRRDKKNIDKISATIILQSFLENK